MKRGDKLYIRDIDLKLKDWAYSQRKNLPYDVKLVLTNQRIVDWYENFNGEVYISFSGGLDSTVLLDLVRKQLGNNIPAVFSNTGLEYPELVEHVKNFDNVTIIKPEKSFRQVINEYGYPVVSKETAAKVRKLRHGNLSDRYRNYLMYGDERGKFGKIPEKWKILLDAPFETSEICCDVMKKNPFKKYHKETGRYPFIGTTQDEGFMRERMYSKTGCNVYDSNTPKSQPLGFWTKQDALRYVIENDLKIPCVYGDIICENGILRTTGVQRTGCIFCAFGVHLEEQPNRFQQMAKTHPQLYRYCINDLGIGKVLDYINVPYGICERREQMSMF